MIIIKYLIKKILKNQISMLIILILIFVSQKVISILSFTINRNITSNLIFPLLCFAIPEILQLILPLSLFLSLLIIYSKLYVNSEIIVMHSCGLGKKVLVIVALIMALSTSIIAVINVFWIMPWSAKYQDQILTDIKFNPNLIVMVEGQFKIIKDQNIVLYVNKLRDKKFNDIFIVQLYSINNRSCSVIIAETGYIKEDKNGNQIIVLDKGTSYEVTTSLCNFRITDFKNYQAVINHKKTIVTGDKVEQNNMLQLWNDTDIKSKLEFHWRLTLVIATIIMALIVVPLSEVNPRYGRTLSMLPAVLLYLVFFLLQSALHSSTVKKSEIDFQIIIVWSINAVFLLLAFILNIWNTAFVRQLYIKLYKVVNLCLKF